MVIDGARGQNAITPNSALKRPVEAEERDEAGRVGVWESEVRRKRTDGRTSISHRFWQEATGHFASWAAARQETWPTCSSIEAGMEENAEGARKPNF